MVLPVLLAMLKGLDADSLPGVTTGVAAGAGGQPNTSQEAAPGAGQPKTLQEPAPGAEQPNTLQVCAVAVAWPENSATLAAIAPKESEPNALRTIGRLMVC